MSYNLITKTPLNGPPFFSIVLQLDPRFISIGVVGRASPSTTIETNNTQWNLYLHQSVDLDITSTDTFIDHTTLISLTPLAESVRRILLQDLESQQWLYNYDMLQNDDERILNILQKVFYHFFYSVLTLNAKDCKLIIPDPVWMPDALKRVIFTVLFRKFYCQSIVLIPSPLLCCISSGVTTALVIDIGWENVSVAPVYDFYMMDNLTQISERGGKWLHYETLRYLLEILGNKLPHLHDNQELFLFIERIIKSFYVRSNFDDIKQGSIKLEGGIGIPEVLRYEILERMLFEQDGDRDESSLIDMVMVNLSKKLPLDCKSEVFENIIITGELSKLPGVKAAIIRELRKKVPSQEFQLLECLGPWAGASLYCSTILVPTSSSLREFGELKRDSFLNNLDK